MRRVPCVGLVLILLAVTGQPVLGLRSQERAACASTAMADPMGVGNAEELEDFLGSFLFAQLVEFHIPGAAVAVVADGKLVFAKAYGHADIESDTFATAEETLFRFGSVTSLFTWTAVMQLVESGELDLHVDVNTYLGGFRIPDTYAQPVTLAHLATHTAGFEEAGDEYVAQADDALTMSEVLADGMPQRVRPPGEEAAYSDYGVGLAGHIIEQVSGMPFESYIEQRVLGPLGMRSTTARQPVPDELAPHLANGYTYTGAGYAVYDFERARFAPAGGMSGTVTDMARFMTAQLQGGRYGAARILEEDTARDMQRQHFTHDPRLNGVTYGFSEMSLNGQRIIGQEGDTVLFHSLLALLPERNEGLYVCYNSAVGKVARDRLLKAFMNHYYPPSTESVAPPPGSRERVARCVGYYQTNRITSSNYRKILGLLDGVLRVSANADGTLRVAGADWVETDRLLFRAVDGQRLLAFREDGSGHISDMFAGKIPTVAFRRLAWYETEAFHVGVLVLCMLVLLSAVLSWSVAALLRRRRGVARTGERHSLSGARLVAGAVAVLDGLSLGMLLFILGRVRANVATRVPSLLLPVVLVEFIAAVLTLGVVWFAVVAWFAGRRGAERQTWSTWSRVHYTAAAVAAVTYLVWLWHWNLLCVPA